jgi:hypothetical protein
VQSLQHVQGFFGLAGGSQAHAQRVQALQVVGVNRQGTAGTVQGAFGVLLRVRQPGGVGQQFDVAGAVGQSLLQQVPGLAEVTPLLGGMGLLARM